MAFREPIQFVIGCSLICLGVDSLLKWASVTDMVAMTTERVHRNKGNIYTKHYMVQNVGQAVMLQPAVMFKKINAVFRPNHGHQSREDYHNACTVRLVRSTSMLVVGEKNGVRQNSTLKRSVSAVSVESSTALYYYHSREDRVWLYSQNQNCLEYLQELVALRRQYTKSISDLKQAERHETVSGKKKPAPQPPQHRIVKRQSPQPSAPPIPSEEDTLQFFDEVIASCDPERSRKPHVDEGHADVDLVVATSTCEHDLHSNWVLRDPRRVSMDESRLRRADVSMEQGAWKKAVSGTTGSTRRLQRYPIHLPKVVESAFQTLRFKPKLKKKD